MPCHVLRSMPSSRPRWTAILKRVAAAGEPFRGFFAPEELARELRAMGYETIEDLDGEEINRRYFANRVDRLGCRQDRPFALRWERIREVI